MTATDFHQHLWPASFVRALEARREPPCVDRGELVTVEGTFAFDAAVHEPEARLATLDHDGIDRAVLSLQPSLGLERLPAGEQRALEDAWLDGIGEIVAASDGRFVALGPGRVVEGLPGAATGASTLVDLERGAALLDAAERTGCLVFVHPEAAAPPGPGQPEWWSWTAGYTAQMQAAYLSWLAVGRRRWPTVRIVFAILAGGAPFQLERLSHRGIDVRSALDDRVLFDTSTYGRRAIELVIETFGVGQLVYGSDRPVVDPASTLRAVRGFGDAVARMVQVETPAALLP